MSNFNTSAIAAARAAAKNANAIYQEMKRDTLIELRAFMQENPDLELTANQISALTGMSVNEIAYNMNRGSRYNRFFRPEQRMRETTRRFIELDASGNPIEGGEVLQVTKRERVYFVRR